MEIIVRRKRSPDAIPDPAYRQEAQKRQLRSQGWDYDRAVRHIRSRMSEDKQGRKQVDLTK